MELDASLAVAAATFGVIWLAGGAPRSAFVLAVTLALALPLIRSTFQVMDLVVLLVAVQVLVTTELPVALLAVGMFVALTVNDAWLRIADGRSFVHPSVLSPAIVTALAVGLGLQGRRLRRINAELVTLRDRDRQRAVLDERRRLAREVHDEVAHHASAIAVRSELALKSGVPNELSATTEFAARTAQEMLKSLHRAIELLDDDPTEMMAAVLRRMREAGLVIHDVGFSLQGLPRDVAMTVVRATQESMTNVLRHRGPGSCWLTLVRNGDRVELVVEDDGPATAIASPDTSTVRRPFGLAAMRERAESLGGDVSVGESPRGGWQVNLRLPIA